MIALYTKDYFVLGFLLLAQIAILVYLLANRNVLFRERRFVLTRTPVPRASRIFLAVLTVIAAAVGYQYTAGLIASQENLIAAIGASDTPSSLLVSASTLKLLSILLPGIFGAAGIGLAVASPS